MQNFVAFDEFCIRACKDGPNAPQLCQHVYDVLGCEWNMPGDYSAGAFDQCLGDTGEVRAPSSPPFCVGALYEICVADHRASTADGRVRHLDVPPGPARDTARAPRARDVLLRTHEVARERSRVSVDHDDDLGGERQHDPCQLQQGEHRGESCVLSEPACPCGARIANLRVFVVCLCGSRLRLRLVPPEPRRLRAARRRGAAPQSGTARRSDFSSWLPAWRPSSALPSLYEASYRATPLVPSRLHGCGRGCIVIRGQSYGLAHEDFRRTWIDVFVYYSRTLCWTITKGVFPLMVDSGFGFCVRYRL